MKTLVGAGLPAMDVNDDALFLDKRVALESIASKLGSYRICVYWKTGQPEPSREGGIRLRGRRGGRR